MEYEMLIRLAVAAFIGGMAKFIWALPHSGKARLREEYRFSKEFLTDLLQTPKIHPLAIEKGFYALAGTASVKSAEVAYVISLAQPDRCLKDYILSRRYLTSNGDDEITKIDFAIKYKGNWARLWRKAVYLIMYVAGAILALAPFLLHGPLGLQSKHILIFSLVTIPGFGFFAFDGLWSFMKIHRAEALVKAQEPLA